MPQWLMRPVDRQSGRGLIKGETVLPQFSPKGKKRALLRIWKL